MTRALEITNLGVVEYDDGLDLQEALRAGVGSGEIPDQFLLLEHPPVVTVGRNSDGRHVLLSRDALERRGIGLYDTGRGGDVTYHGPGQIVGYPVVNLDPDRRDVRRYVRDLEETIIRALADFGVGAGRIPGLTGVWTGDLKIAAIGVRISRWITTHGFAFNVGTDLNDFNVIVPCGLADHGVTSLERYLGEPVDRSLVRERLAHHFCEVFERDPVPRDVTSFSVQVLVWRRAADGIEVLLLKRTEREGGFWQPVTGMVDPGESPERTAARELTEETGLTGTPVSLDYVRDFRIDRRYVGGSGPHPWVNREHAFAVEEPAGAVRLSPEEHEEYLWTGTAEAKERLRWNGNRRALDRLERMAAAAA